MIYLYIKTHNKTGLKYLGKTIQDPFTYLGSGLYWLRHIKEHGNDISTEIIFQSNDKDKIKEIGISYSNLYNVVKSDEWANLTEERGDGGNTFSGRTHTMESKRKMREAKIGKIFSEEHKKNLSSSHAGKQSGEKNPFFGKHHSTETKKKISDVLIGKVRSTEFKEHLSKIKSGIQKPKVVCPHCFKEGGKPVMARYHFDNCKHK